MPKQRFLKTSACAALLVLPLGLVACGSDTESEAASTTTATSSSTHQTSSSQKPSTSTETSSEETSQEQAPPPEEPGQPAPPAPDQGENVDSINPLTGEVGQTQLGAVAPVEGAPASPEDQRAIEDLLRGQYKVRTTREFAEYMLVNGCQKLIDANGGEAAFDRGEVPDLPVAQMPGFQGSGIQSVEDVRVNGDTASAVVTSVSGNGQSHTGTMRFQRQGGKWTFCS